MRSVCRVMFIVFACATRAAAAPEPTPRLDPWKLHPKSTRDCDDVVHEHPNEHEAYFCYLRLAYTWPRGRGPVIEHLERWLASRPDDALARLYLGILEVDDNQGERAHKHFQLAAEGFRARGDRKGEVYARSNLARQSCTLGQMAEATRQLEQQASAAEASADAELIANARLTAGFCSEAVADYGRAIALYNEAKDRLWAARPSFATNFLKQWALDGLGNLYSATGRHREAFEVDRQQAEIISNNTFLLTSARFRIAYEGFRLADQGEMSWEEVDRFISDAMALEDQRYPNWPPYYARILAALRIGPGPAAIEYLEKAVSFGRTRDLACAITASRILAKFEIDRDPAHPEGATRRAGEALALSRESGAILEVAQSLLTSAYVRWKSGARVEAKRDALAAIDAFDQLRDLQPEAMVRALATSESAFAYPLVAGWLLDRTHGAADPEDMNLAFSISERLRARVLLDSLVSARVDVVSPGPLRDRRESILVAIARTQRRLIDPALAAPDRERELAELARLEREEQVVRDQLARQNPDSAALHRPLPSLAQVQQALGPDEALLSFQTWRLQHTDSALYDDGSSWLLAVSRDQIRAIRIPDAEKLQQSVRQLRALIARHDGSEARGATRLYRDLMQQALAALPSAVARLIIVPDGPLHGLPFEVLRATPEAPPLAARYQVSITPSAALWLHWRSTAPAPARVPALVLADPLTSTAAIARYRQATTWRAGLSLGPLPYSRDEGRAVVKALGRGSQLLVGAEASERALKTADLGAYGIVHFAAHAVVDDEQPERSAVILAPGAESEDGLLQMRDVIDLNLTGRAVVLAACDSAAGPILRGEGVLSLARAFFQAGAHTVVGSRWPLRDDEAAELVTAFYRGLGRGLSVAQAMAEAKRERIRAGAPAAEWAGLMVLGDGNLVPVPRPPGPGSTSLLLWAALSAAFVGALTLFIFRRARRV